MGRPCAPTADPAAATSSAPRNGRPHARRRSIGDVGGERGRDPSAFCAAVRNARRGRAPRALPTGGSRAHAASGCRGCILARWDRVSRARGSGATWRSLRHGLPSTRNRSGRLRESRLAGGLGAGGGATAVVIPRPAALRRRPETGPWAEIVASGMPAGVPREGPSVLMATSVGGHPIAPKLDSLVGMALWLRGATPRFLLCDAALPACEQAQYTAFKNPRTFVARGPRPLCDECFGRGFSWLSPLPLALHRYSEFVRGGEQRTMLAETQSWSIEN